MPRRRAPYPSEFRRQMVEFVRAGHTPEELSREFQPSTKSSRWSIEKDEVLERSSCGKVDPTACSSARDDLPLLVFQTERNPLTAEA